MTKLFEIEQYVKTHQRIFVECNFPKLPESIEVPISRTDFERWLDKMDRLDWVKDSVNHEGEHIQEIGRFTLSQYWEYAETWQKYNDLYDYIIVKGNKNVFENIEAAIRDITNDYAE